jgi:NADH-quinone oxidoreductase subunit N
MGTELLYMLPLAIASFFAVFVPIFDVMSKSNKQIVFYATLLNFVLIIISSINLLIGYYSFYDFSLYFGGYTSIFDSLFSTAAILTLLGTKQYLDKQEYHYKEFYSLMNLALLGMMIINHAGNLLIMFIGIELMSISFFVLAGFIRTKLFSIEASLKYFLLGAFATGFLVYGMAMIYGSTGEIEFKLIAQKIAMSNFNFVYLAIGMGLILVGLAFKSSIVPFHQWAPDVYTGAPTNVTSFMSTAGKTAAFVAFILITKHLFLPTDKMILNVLDSATQITQSAQFIIAILSAMTMIIGNITALVQSNVKRMLAFSSVAHAGYILMGIVSSSINGWAGISFYAAAYIFMQIGAFTIVSIIENKDDSRLNLHDYNGLSKSNPFLAFAMAIFMFSLVGLPPFGGFFGKYFLFYSTIQAGYLWLTVLAVIASLISVYFYIGLIINMYFKEQDKPMEKLHLGMANISIIISIFGILALGLMPDTLINTAIKVFTNF